MKKPTLEDYQSLPISSVYLTTIVEKVPEGRIPSISMCAIVRYHGVYIRLDWGKIFDSKRFFLSSTRPISDYYRDGEYSFCIKDGHVSIEFADNEPFERYKEYAGRNFDTYVREYIKKKRKLRSTR